MPKLPKITSFISLQYLKKEVSDEVDFLPANKPDESFLQIGTMIFHRDGQAFPKIPK